MQLRIKEMMQLVFRYCCLGTVLFSGSLSAQNFTYKEFIISIDARNNFEMYSQQLQKLALSSSSKVDINASTRNEIKYHEIIVKTDEIGFEAFRKQLMTYTRILDSNLYIRNKYQDTLYLYEQLKRLENRKQKLMLEMDTMKVGNTMYKIYEKELNTINSEIALKLKKKEEVRIQQVVRIQLYENHKKFMRKDQRYRDREWDDYFMPGLGYNRIVPSMKDSFGMFSGFTPEFTIYARYKQNAKGPSYIKTYFRVGILNSDKATVGKMLLYAVGTNFSFENKMKREWLIPYFGMETGGISQKRTGPSLFVMPQLGVYLFANKQLQVYVNGGYLYSFSHPYEYESYTMSAGLNFLLWR